MAVCVYERMEAGVGEAGCTGDCFVGMSVTVELFSSV